ncbi:aminotransferase class III-fold pyridoxal phosphate-dependent enzyme [Micromonospora sp. WMMA1949]|uniref:aminotransferase family protein n=1 Tax=unclassified Micromonospora TaxID=2617518 RepID=UPI0022B67340|nr:aminotransferase class III-fold pyridoxal phosphate-dependent enzyme [Micromonospora sp. WMMA1949]MCZ7428579.1 aminotransferase class III-fold pyridoxal phosphate-dependent enzyme [Micromonospora sp. WMMA1949]
MNAYLKTLSPSVMLTEGRGVRVRDSGGRWFLDARSGLWNVTLGYDHPAVREAIKRQVDALPYANLIGYGRPAEIAVTAANALLPHLPPNLKKVRYCSNGSQANETAMLLSRFLHRAAGQPDRTAVFGMWRGFHGLGAAGGALTGLPYVHRQAGPLLPDVRHAPGPFEPMGDGSRSDLERTIEDYGPERVAAVVVEPIVGEGGHVLGADYLRSLAAFCRARGIHFVVDEVTTGMGRTGAFTRTGQLDVDSDILLLGKGLTSGYAPLAAVVLSDEIFAQLYDLPYTRQFFIGSTNDGHPLALAASIAVIETLAKEGLLDNVTARGEQLHAGLLALSSRHPRITAVRGSGLMYAVELGHSDGKPVEEAATNHLRLAMEARGVLVSTLALWPAIMIIPPLIIEPAEIDEILLALDLALDDIAVLF